MIKEFYAPGDATAVAPSVIQEGAEGASDQVFETEEPESASAADEGVNRVGLPTVDPQSERPDPEGNITEGAVDVPVSAGGRIPVIVMNEGDEQNRPTGGTPPPEEDAGTFVAVVDVPLPPVEEGGVRDSATHPIFSVIPGTLCEAQGLRLSIRDEVVPPMLVVERGDRPITKFPISIKRSDLKPTSYPEVTLAALAGCVPLTAKILNRFPRNKSKSLSVHRIVAILGRRADLTMNGGKVEVHHADLNGGNNRVTNLATLSCEVHEALHREIDRDRGSYLAHLTAGRDWIDWHSEPTRRAIENDMVKFEGRTNPFDEMLSGLIGEGERSAEELMKIGRTIGEPDKAEVSTVSGARKKMCGLAELLQFNLTGVLLAGGYESLDASAIMTLVRGNGDVFFYENGDLFMYNYPAGRFQVADEQFEQILATYAITLIDERRQIKLATGDWLRERATIALDCLPKVTSGRELIRDARNSVYPLWSRPGERMNGDQRLLNLKNGLLDPRTSELLPHTSDHLSSIQLPYDYDPGAEAPTFLAFLKNALSSVAEIDVIQEFFGYCLIASTEKQVALVIVGPGKTGKSTAIKVLSQLVGEANTSSVPLEKLGDRFLGLTLKDKLLNVATEVDAGKRLNDARFKAFVSGDPVMGERKFKDPVTFSPYARFVIAANTLPKVDDLTDAFFRRLILVKFGHKFVEKPDPAAFPPERQFDPDLPMKLRNELPGILNWALVGLKRLEERGHFDIPEVLKKNVLEMRQEQSSALQFLVENCTFDPSFEVRSGEIYDAYCSWCKYEHEKPLSKNKFGHSISHWGKEIKPAKVKKSRGYRGVRLKSAEERVDA